MRTPNTECSICGKPLYRRPSEFKEGVEFCCKECRGILYKNRPPSENLKLGREKGTNHLKGIPKSDESNNKRAESNKEFWANNKEKAIQRGEKTRGNKHYNWKGGISSLNRSIRTMTENRKWMDAVKERDKMCVKCGSTESLESHHLVELADIIDEYNIKNRNDARICTELWNINNGITLCTECHYKEHNRIYNYDNNRAKTL